MSPMSVLSLINVSELEMGPSSIISHFVAVIALLTSNGTNAERSAMSNFINDHFLIPKIYFCIGLHLRMLVARKQKPSHQ